MSKTRFGSQGVMVFKQGNEKSVNCTRDPPPFMANAIKNFHIFLGTLPLVLGHQEEFPPENFIKKSNQIAYFPTAFNLFLSDLQELSQWGQSKVSSGPMRKFLSWLHDHHPFPFPASKLRVLLTIWFGLVWFGSIDHLVWFFDNKFNSFWSELLVSLGNVCELLCNFISLNFPSLPFPMPFQTMMLLAVDV